MTKPQIKPRAFGYTRVSSIDQVDGQSLDVQREQLAALCTLNGLELAAVYTEEGVSGARPFVTRPEGSRVWADVRRGDYIVVTKLDRLGRSPRDVLSLLDECKKRGVGLVIGDMGASDVTQGAVASMLVGILSCVAGFERERNGERVAEVKASMRRDGRFIGGAVPFGHRVVERDGQKFVEADEALQARVMDLHRREFSARMICAELRRDGIEVSNVTLSKFLRGVSAEAA